MLQRCAFIKSRYGRGAMLGTQCGNAVHIGRSSVAHWLLYGKPCQDILMKIILASYALALLLTGCVSAPSDLYGVHSALPEQAPAPGASSGSDTRGSDTRHFFALPLHAQTK